MSRQLIESIVSKNMLEASDMLEAKLDEIKEKKMYEMKRMFAAKMYEGVGGLTKAEIEARKKAGYRKASEVLGDPRKGTTSIPGHTFKKVKKKVVEESLDEDTMANVVKMMNTLRSKGIRGRIGRATLKRVRGRESTYDPLKQAEKFAKDKPEAAKPEAPKPKSLDYPDTPGGRNRKKADERLAKREGPESGKSAWERSVGGKIHSAIKKPVGAVAQELGSIGFSNLN